jgi:hypothetical protein
MQAHPRAASDRFAQRLGGFVAVLSCFLPGEAGADEGRDDSHRVFSKISRPISMRRISEVPAPIS